MLVSLLAEYMVIMNTKNNFHDFILRYTASILIIFYVYISYFKVLFGLSIPAIIAILLFLFIFLRIVFFVNYFKLKINKVYTINLFFMVSFAFIYISVNNSIPFNKINNLISSFILFSIFYYIFKNLSEKRSLIIIKIFLYTILVSALVAIFQFFNYDFAWELKFALPEIEDKFVKESVISKNRITGLSYFSVTLGYHLVCGLVLALMLIKKNEINFFYYLLILTILFLAGSLGKNLSFMI